MREPPQPPSSAWLVVMSPSAAVGARTPAAQPPARAAGAATSAPIPPTTLRQMMSNHTASRLHPGHAKQVAQCRHAGRLSKTATEGLCTPGDLRLCRLAGQRQARHRAQLYAVVGNCWVSYVAGALGHHKVDCACKIDDNLSGRQKTCWLLKR